MGMVAAVVVDSRQRFAKMAPCVRTRTRSLAAGVFFDFTRATRTMVGSGGEGDGRAESKTTALHSQHLLTTYCISYRQWHRVATVASTLR